MKTKLILSLLFLCFCLSCKKEEVLPKATQNGANTFGCKINGKNWVADAGNSFSGKQFVVSLEDTGRFILNANHIHEDDNSSITLGIAHLTNTGTYYFNESTDSWPRAISFKNFASYERNKPSPFKEFITNTAKTGVLKITKLDKSARIISGTFEFTAENLDGTGETIKVTDGRFDIKY